MSTSSSLLTGQCEQNGGTSCDCVEGGVIADCREAMGGSCRQEVTTATQTTCPLCGGRSSLFINKHGCDIRECTKCGHRFAGIEVGESHVAEVYGDDYFFAGGAGYSNYLAEERLLVAHGRRYARLLARFGTPGRMLDVGAAAGFLLKGFMEHGWSGVGIEPNPHMVQSARDLSGLDVRLGTLESVWLPERFDLVSLIQVMAHFADPKLAVQRVSELTRPNGLCLVETWNVSSWTARAFGANWHEYSPPSVLHWFSKRTLQTLFEQYGFRLIHYCRPTKYLDIQHGKTLLAHTWRGPLGALVRGVLKAVPERLAVPYPLDDVMCLVFRRDP